MTESNERKEIMPLDDRGRGIRDRLVERLRGRGLEIGALARPMRLDPTRATAHYVDCFDLDRLRENYPELEKERLVDPDYVIPGETLKGIPRESQDFVIASHVFEHVEDPLGILGEWHRVLRPGGLLYLAVPDKRFTLDRSRPRTNLSHLIRDHQDGGEGSREGHIKEFGRAHLRLATEKEQMQFVQRVDQIDYKVHFHAWLPEDVRGILRHSTKKLGLPWKIEEMVEAGHEVILLARKVRRGKGS